MLEPEGRKSSNVLVPDLVPLRHELVQRRVHVDRVPEHDQIDRQPERAQLVLLTLSVTLAQLTPPAMKDDAGELVTVW